MKKRTIYFDRSRKSGRWVTIVRDEGALVTMTEHTTERNARRFIGLDGGSQRP